MNIDKFTVIIVGVILVSITVFLDVNYNVLYYSLNVLSLQVAQTLMFLCLIGTWMLILSFRGDRRSTIIGVFLPFIFLLFVVAHYSPLTLDMPNIHLLTPIEEIPIDFGLMGLVFILITGFLLSYVLIGKGIDKSERLLLSTGLGFGTISLIMILLGILWEISKLTIMLTQATLLFFLLVTACKRLKLKFREHLRHLKGCPSSISKFNLLELFLLALIGTCTIVAIYQTVTYPAIEWDSLAYGVNYAKIIFEDKKVPLIAGPSIGLEMSANYPPGVQLLAVYFYTLAGDLNDFYYRVLQPIFGLAVMVATYKFAMIMTKSRTASLFAIFILSIIPIFWEWFIRESYLMCLTLMLTLAAYFFFKAYKVCDSDARKYEVIGVLFCGFSTLISYIGIFSLGLVFLYAKSRRLNVKRFLLLIASALIIMLPWYMRNFLLLGNPIYPFFGIGNYLDPLLKSSTTQHFQNWLKDPLFGLISITCKLGVFILSLTIVYLTFVKQKNFVMILTLYLLFVGISLMAFHVPFARYLIISLPMISAVLSATIKTSLEKHDPVENVIAIILISLVLILSVHIIPYLNFIKPMYPASDKWDYLSQIYDDADAWKWINENTPSDSGVATYDIREYYIERKMMLLDGYNASPLYHMNSVEECINYLMKQNIEYILSVTWASPMDNRMPPAYKWCILTRYLGDPRYLPPIYVSPSGATVYHVGPLEEKIIYEYFSQKDLVPPLKHLKINLTITNQTSPPSGKFYIPIPIDYREGLMIASVNSHGHLVNIELLNRKIPKEMTTNWRETFEIVKMWPQSANISGVKNPSFVWEVDRAGYLTFLVAAEQELFKESFSVTVDITFYNYWDKNSLFIHEGFDIYNIASSNLTFPLMKTLYIQVNEPSVLSINSTTFGKKISLEIFKEFIPNNVAINWSEQYEIIRQQPNLNEISGAINPSISNMFLPCGKYSIVVIHRDNYMEQVDILLKIKFTPLREEQHKVTELSVNFTAS